ncbi:MAG: beta-galactosidase [Bifidobacterium tsurumiense]|uniref:beta-galactosidase n=1 Tax=Bifidobacterium tsurumiense TaxID=356829 RepID=UPI002A8234E1|nr:beta-galactosidase [Bifidobacterium tsurumiense]MDY4677706.1 beta-galactosidase [Bifidobacterium tsurumiense]
METQVDKIVKIEDSALLVNGKRAQLYGGAVHYWRLDRDKWDVILNEIVNLGFTMVSIYIPWEAHEVSRGVFDFGQIDPRTDIDAFLTLCEDKGLSIVVRPGPQINSEMTWFGYPKRILDNERLQAKNSSGARAVLTQVPKPIPALSYAVDEFFDETALWYDAICPILAKHSVNNGGGIVACQVDNEMAFFFGINAYSGDYCEASLHKYRQFLIAKYGSSEKVAAAYGLESIADFDEFQPPRRFEKNDRKSIPWYEDWAEYRETYLINSMDRLAGMLRERGLDQIALFHNYPHPLGPGGAASGFTCPFNLPKLEEKLDFVGFDIYSRKHLYSHIKTVASYVVGTSRYPYIPEFIAGVWAWYLHPGDEKDEEFVTKAALMQGIKGFSRYMLVERDKWFFSPIRRDGTVRPMSSMHSTMNKILKGVDFNKLQRRSDVLLLANREYDRLEAASVLVSFPGDFLETPSGFSEYPNHLTVADERFDFDSIVVKEKNEYFNAFHGALRRSGIGYVLSDTDLNPDRWSKFPVVVIVSEDWMDEATQSALVSFAKNGGTIVLGPKVPSLGHDMEPCTVLADAMGVDPGSVNGKTVKASIGSGHVFVVPDIGEAPQIDEIITQAATVSRFVGDDDRLDVVVHDDKTDPQHKVVFICNPTDTEIQSKIKVDFDIATASDLWTGESISVDDGCFDLNLPPYSIIIADSTVAEQ